VSFKFKLNNSSGVPYYRQIIDHITYSVINNILKPGEQLPTVRKAAVDLEVNLNTVVKAYNELEYKGIVTTQQGTGTFITHKKPEVDPAKQEQMIEHLCTSFLDNISSLGISTDKVMTLLEKIIAQRKQGTKNE